MKMKKNNAKKRKWKMKTNKKMIIKNEKDENVQNNAEMTKKINEN